eukprot:CAMPEP_0177648644 /NCGR_PEP_ID=MMETSP0447-20121125/10935_1 /TAXON_ID=0 /ORGANISM="Stygamoeba regulata, Strain BSH-02190019" /LENGTH=198 /DNA_ID=CAMNT_0019151293 /DNA_START=101 /DNA_END=697 /DNA_ORIENTATION=-
MSCGRTSPALLLLALTAVCLLLVAAVRAEPVLIARKGLLNTQAVKDRDVAVSIDIFNVGTSAAHNVKLQDGSWFEPTTAGAFELVNGLASAAWSSLPAGGNISHTFVIRPTEVAVNVDVRPALITFFDAENKETKSVYSTESMLFEIYPFSTIAIGTSVNYVEWATFVGIAAATTLPAVLLWSSSASRAVSSLNKKQK